jgi:voltage-gated potassium channel
MAKPLRRVLIGLISFAAVIVVSWFGYIALGCRSLDAIYMVIITIFGIGYQEFCPMSETSRMFTIFVIVAGTSSVLFTFGGVIQMMTEGELNRIIAQRHKTRDIANLAGHTIICGYNHIGQILAQQLEKEAEKFVIVEASSERLTSAEELGYRVCQGLATDEQVLVSAGIERAKALATVLPDDADNLFITLSARGLNQSLTILARGDIPSTDKKLRQAGADHVILPAIISGMRMANLITQPTAVDFLRQNAERDRLNEMLAHLHLQMSELTVAEGTDLAGLTIADMEVRGKGIFIIVALRRGGGDIIIQPEADLVVDGGDTLIVLGHEGSIPQFTQRHNISHPSRYKTGVR